MECLRQSQPYDDTVLTARHIFIEAQVLSTIVKCSNCHKIDDDNKNATYFHIETAFLNIEIAYCLLRKKHKQTHSSISAVA